MTSLHCVQEGRGPIVVLSHALGSNLGMWDAVVAILKDRFTLFRYDHRNHGKSEQFQTPFTIDDMADDAASLILEVAAGKKVHFAGLSMGGMVAQSLAARHPQLLSSVVIANSAEYYDDSAKKNWTTRIESVNANGIRPIAEAIISRWFTPEFIRTQKGSANDLVEESKIDLEDCDPLAYALSCNAVANIDFRIPNTLINMPTLIIAGIQDQATPVALSQSIHRNIKNSELIEINAAHLSAIEKPIEFANALQYFYIKS